MGVYIKDMQIPTDCKLCPFENYGYCCAKYDYIRAESGRDTACPLVEVPTPPVRPSRPRGEWIADPKNQGGFTPGGNAVMSCSCCGWIYGAHRIFPDYNYCPNCGADMKGDK